MSNTVKQMMHLPIKTVDSLSWQTYEPLNEVRQLKGDAYFLTQR